MTRNRLLLVLASAAVLPTCSGQVVVPGEGGSTCTGEGCACRNPSDCGIGYDCVAGRCVAATCSPFVPGGDCPIGRECSNGICVMSGTPAMCECGVQQGCTGGACADIDDDNACGATRLDGLCLTGTVCSGGACKTITRETACSPERPGGLCPGSSTCIGGYCLPVTEDPCSATSPEGRCDSGMVCAPPGHCEVPRCSATAPFGFCDPGFFCSAGARCIPYGSCDAGSDCDEHYRCDGGTCRRDVTCAASDECLAGESCSVAGICLPSGMCAVGADCDLDQICSASGQCIAAGTCVVDADCIAPATCGSTRTCLAPGKCGGPSDCPPGHDCTAQTCVPGGQLCTGNVADPSACEPGTCCPEGQRCSTAGSCIIDGLCVSDRDCLADSFVCGDDYRCVPVAPCTVESCGGGAYCSVAGACIPTGKCAADGDCPEGEVCNALFACVTGQNCGSAEFPTQLVEPNMLIVLDRSGSMSVCDADGDSRWNAAVKALNAVLQANAHRLRFGLSTYPLFCGGDPSCKSCSGVSCSSSCPVDSTITNCQPGAVDVAVSVDTVTAIEAALAANYPGGATPTGPTLRGILANRAGFGLPDPSDPLARGNHILLVTDGEPNCDGTSAAARVNGALEGLRLAGVTTYVVGVAFSSVSASLNCNAAFGGTSRCESVVERGACSGEPSSCVCTGSSPTPCYYEAGDETTLTQAFDDIVNQVASCSYSLETQPPDVSRLYVYLESADGFRTRIDRDTVDGWEYSATMNQVRFYGASCQVLQAGGGTPVVVYGCPDTSG